MLTRAASKALLTPWRFAFAILSVSACMCIALVLFLEVERAAVDKLRAESAFGRSLYAVERSPLSKLDLLRDEPNILPEALVYSLEAGGGPVWYSLRRRIAVADNGRTFSLDAVINLANIEQNVCWVGNLPLSGAAMQPSAFWLGNVLHCPAINLPEGWHVMKLLRNEGAQVLLSSQSADTWLGRGWRAEVQQAYFTAEPEAIRKEFAGCCVVNIITLRTNKNAQEVSTALRASLIATLAVLSALIVGGQKDLMRLEVSLRRISGHTWKRIASAVIWESILVTFLPWFAGAMCCLLIVALWGRQSSMDAVASLLMQTLVATIVGSVLLSIWLLQNLQKKPLFGIMKT